VSTPHASHIACEDKERLQKAITITARDHDMASELLAHGPITIPEETKHAVRQYLEEIRVKLADAREALARHVAEHGC